MIAAVTRAATVAKGLDALGGLPLLATVAWALVSGTVAAWVGHRYTSEGEGYDEHAVLTDATCAACGHVISLSEATPVRSAKCSACRTRLPWTWIATPISVLAACLAMLATFGAQAVVLPFLWLVPVLVTASVVDLRTMLIPKRLVWVGFGIGLASIVGVALWKDATDTLTSAVIGAAGYFAFLAVLNFVMPSGMGWGDVRLSLVLGLYLGWIDWRLTIFGLLIANVVYLAYALPMRASSGQRHSPFGPGLAAGTVLAIVFYASLLPT